MQQPVTNAASPENIRRVLTGAARMFRQGGWSRKYEAVTANGTSSVSFDREDAVQYCLAGGICKTALEVYPRFSQEHADLSHCCIEAVKKELAERGELRPGLTAGWWNDQKGREAAQVIEVLETAARKQA